MSVKIKKAKISRNIYMYEMTERRGGKDVLISSLAFPKCSLPDDSELESILLLSKNVKSGFLGAATNVTEDVLLAEISGKTKISIKGSVVIDISGKSMSVPLSCFKKSVNNGVEEKVISLLDKSSKGKITRAIGYDIIKDMIECSTENIDKKDDLIKKLQEYMPETAAAKIFLALFSVFGIKSEAEIVEIINKSVSSLVRETYVSTKEINKADILSSLC